MPRLDKILFESFEWASTTEIDLQAGYGQVFSVFGQSIWECSLGLEYGTFGSRVKVAGIGVRHLWLKGQGRWDWGKTPLAQGSRSLGLGKDTFGSRVKVDF